MRLSFPALLSLLCASVACTGGPTSDWPRGTHDNGDDDSAPTNPATPTGPKKPTVQTGGSNTGTAPITTPPTHTTGGFADAGTAASTPASDSTNSGEPASPGSSGGSHDAGVLLDAGDAGPDATVMPFGPDGSTGFCSAGAVAHDAGCADAACPAPAQPQQLAFGMNRVGACLGADDVALACSGDLASVAASCAMEDASALGLGGGVSACARSAPSLAYASDGCIDCYVSETLCAVQACLAACLAGHSSECSSCRSAKCGAAFEACSGLPSPNP